MLGSLQTTGWSFARPFRLMAIIVTTAGAILVGYVVHGERAISVDQAPWYGSPAWPHSRL